MVDVNTQNKTISVNVSSSGVSSNVNASGDTTLYYSNKAKEWAISNRIVDGVDYSSKYYAGRANQSALNAQSFAQSAQDSYNDFQDSVDGALSTVNDTAQDAITTIDTKSDEAIETINNTVDGVIEDIEAEANEQIANIERTGFYMRDDKLYFINSEGEEEEFKSGGGSGFNLFDTKVSDHILEGEEAVGWALQGTWVYKEAIVGERFGYPDFYNECIAQQTAGTSTEITLGLGSSTVTMSVNANGHIFYNIADKATVDTYYAETGIADFYGIDTENERVFLPREVVIVHGALIDSFVTKLKYYCVGNTVSDTSWVDVVEQVEEGVKDIEEAKDYAVDQIRTMAGGGRVEIGDIGITGLGIDETKGLRRYLNGQVIIQDQYTVFTEKVKSAIALYPTLGCTEQEWQTIATMSVGGQVGKFVVDDDAGTIRLPKIIMPIQGLANLANLAEIVEAGLPNIKGKGFMARSTAANVTSSGAIALSRGGSSIPAHENGPGDVTIQFNASRSNDIYGNSTTVQQEQIQYPYFIQVATGAETEDNIINEIELNNPYSLLDVKWSDKLLNNISWLRSNGQPNSSVIYPAIYDLILTEYNSGTDETETVGGITITFRRGATAGIKVTTDKTSFDSILSATGTAWYYVLDTANSAFYLPQSDGFLQFGGDGNFVEAGLPNITGRLGHSNSISGSPSGVFYNGSQALNSFTQSTNQNSQTIYFDASLSNSIYGNSDTVQPNAVKGYLYFYVGETVQNANLINAGRIEEVVSQVKADKLDKSAVKAYVAETYRNGTSWYRVWSDGWCEQGGVLSSSSTTQVITYLKNYLDTNYILEYQINANSTNGRTFRNFGYNKTVSGFTTDTASVSNTTWCTKGYIA